MTLIQDESSGMRSYSGDQRTPGPTVRHESFSLLPPGGRFFKRLTRIKGAVAGCLALFLAP